MAAPDAAKLGAAASVAIEPIERYESYRRAANTALVWDAPFVLPPWVRVWHRHFGKTLDARLCVVRTGNMPIGIAALGIDGAHARLLGSPDVCDHLDCVVAPGYERLFFSGLFEWLHDNGITEIDFGQVLAGSSVMRAGMPLGREHGLSVVCRLEDATFARDLPRSWDDYPALLSGKQRHEARRKLRRFLAAGSAAYCSHQDAASLEEALTVFFRLFRESRPDKAAFLTPDREAFFRDLAAELSAEGFLHIGFLKLDGAPAAAVFCCDYGRTRFLYNSGYDPRYQALNAGFVCKLLSLKDAIERGYARYDFLKGREPYKHRLGGVAADVYRCIVRFR